MAPDPVSKPKKDEHTVRLTSTYTEVAKELADDLGMAFAELLTKACERGLNEMIEEDNKRLLRQKLKRRLAGENLADGHDE
jgi:hypothetical protein